MSQVPTIDYSYMDVLNEKYGLTSVVHNFYNFVSLYLYS